MQILLGYLLQIILVTTPEVFVTANSDREVGNNFEAASHFTIKVIMFCVFWHKTTSSEIWRKSWKKNVELTTTIETLASSLRMVFKRRKNSG